MVKRKISCIPSPLSWPFVQHVLSAFLTLAECQHLCRTNKEIHEVYFICNVLRGRWSVGHCLAPRWHEHIIQMNLGRHAMLQKEYKWPFKLQSLVWRNAELPLIDFTFPPTLTDIKYYIQDSLPAFPRSVRILRLAEILPRRLRTYLNLPHWIEELRCNQTVFETDVVLANLCKLTLTGRNTNYVDLMYVTPNLRTLILNVFVNNIRFPKMLKCMHIKMAGVSLERCRFPESLEVLDCGGGDYYMRFGSATLPIPLKRLYLTNKWMYYDNIPSTTQIKVASDDFCEICGCKLFSSPCS